MIARFTGWHMLATMVAFFGVVIAVNVLMAADAIRTFGGTIVDNSYVATTQYNTWLAAGRRQQAQGWQATPSTDPEGRVSMRVSRAGRPVEGASVVVTANHPVGLVAERQLELTDLGAGLYRSKAALPRGRWLIRIDVRDGAEEAAFEDEVRL